MNFKNAPLVVILSPILLVLCSIRKSSAAIARITAPVNCFLLFKDCNFKSEEQ